MTATEMTKGVLATDTLNIGDQMGGYYGGGYWDGHIDNLLLYSTNLVDNSQQVTDYFSNNDFLTHEGSDKIVSWFKLDPDSDSYPAIADSVGDATGTHSGGSAATAFVTTGKEAPLSSAVLSATPPVGDAGDAAAFYRVFLNGVSQPNSVDIGATVTPAAAGAPAVTTSWAASTSCIGTIPLDRLVFDAQGAESIGEAFLGLGDVSQAGVYVASTVVNEPLSITIQPWPHFTDMANMRRWHMELDVQLISNEDGGDRV
jgi:hypothetical protein